jgi:transcriptional regulator with XRE-family HTH domain
MIGNAGEVVSAREVFHAELARLREHARLSLSELSDETKYDASYLQRLEKGDRLGSLDAARVLDRFYGTGEHISDLWRLAKQEAGKSRYRGFLDLEAEATSIHEFSISAVPGLLQTGGYSKEQLSAADPLRSPELLAEQVHGRLARQERLNGSKPLHYRALLDESVIRRPPRDPGAWTEQLEHLISSAKRPNVTIQIVPFLVGLHRLLPSSLQLLWLPSGFTVGYVESSWSGELVEEADEVEHLRLSYDQLRDSALSTSESLDQLRTALEEHTSCRAPGQI